MKRKTFFLGYLAVLLVTCCTMLLYSCDYFNKPVYTNDGPDSVYVAQLVIDQVESTVNPSFTSVQEVQIRQSDLNKQLAVQDVFCSMPETVLVNVATVCLKKKPTITMEDIVEEYRTNIMIYNNLPEPEQKKQTTTEEQRVVGEVSYKYRLDTAGGKQKIVLLKDSTHEK